MKRIAFRFLFLLLMLTGTIVAQEEYRFERDLFRNQDCKVVMLHNPALGEQVLLMEPLSETNALTLCDSSIHIPWQLYKYLMVEVWQDNNYSVILNIRFEPKNEIPGDNGINLRTGINPKLKTQVIFPLSYLDGQEIFLPRFPRQLKGTVTGHRMKESSVEKVKLSIAPFDSNGFAPSIYIGDIKLLRELPAPPEGIGNYYVDEFGQWNGKKWPGKARNIKEIRDELSTTSALASGMGFPQEWSKYGGWTGKKFSATGFFRTENDGERWWFVDPEGNAFLSMGMDCVDNEISTVFTGNEDLFEWMPGPETGTKAALSTRRNEVMVDFLKSNLIRAWGKDWEQRWADLTSLLLHNLRFNTIGNWSDMNFTRHAGMPYVLPLNRFPTTKIKIYRDFPDVFDSIYSLESIRFAQQLVPYANDPWLLGYFLANEPHWAFGDNILALEMMRTPQKSATRKEMIHWLQDRYAGSYIKFSEAWQIPGNSFTDLDTMTFDRSPSLAAENDLKEFSGMMVDQYISVVCREVKKVDPNHLNLGLRYAWISSDLCYRAGKEFDVFSINGYSNPGPPLTAEIARRSGKPVLIGEFHFGATDRGLPATGIQAAESQKERGDAYRYYVEQGFARPELIGIHYFQWLDQSITGRFDGENYNIGFLDICYKPYNELTDAARATHSRVYEIATHHLSPVSKIIKKIPAIYY